LLGVIILPALALILSACGQSGNPHSSGSAEGPQIESIISTPERDVYQTGELVVFDVVPK